MGHQSQNRIRVLVVGGAGYVGSATAAYLLERGHDVWVLDDLSTGHLEFVQSLGLLDRFIQARAGDRAVVEPFLRRERFDCVMHFAARSLVEESVRKPKEYFENNVLQTCELLEAMHAAGIKRFVFSSTCAIFGDPGGLDIDENLPKKPMNPYGETKLEVERMLERHAHGRDSRGLMAIALRYFNAAGAEPGLRVGEWHNPESHLIPRIFQSIAAGQPVGIMGTDYSTPDGTCVRDYIHVWDLAQAHEAAMLRLMRSDMGSSSGRFEAFNLGSENGFSVREIVKTCEQVLGRKIAAVDRPRRAGDPPRLVANSHLARDELGFEPNNGIERIIESAWNWEEKRKSIPGAIPTNKAVFLDRDGTINDDPGYLSDPEQLKLFPNVGSALFELKKAGYLLVIVSNQSGVGRGLIEKSALTRIHHRLDELMAASSVKLDHYELCFHRPEDGCDCRKPQPKLLIEAARKLGIDLSRSFMIGDKFSDLVAGRAAGCKGVALVRTGHGRNTESKLNPGETDFVGDSLSAAVHWILSQRDQEDNR